MKPTAFNRLSVALGLAFLYLPIILLVLYSFNASRLVTVWGGFSTRWYIALFQDDQLLDAIGVTLKIGLISATLATLLGTLAAVTLVRSGRFAGRTRFSGMIYAPLVMPEVILGLSLLLLFVSLNLPRGFWTVVVAHTTVMLCYATVVIQARLTSFDQSLEPFPWYQTTNRNNCWIRKIKFFPKRLFCFKHIGFVKCIVYNIYFILIDSPITNYCF